MVEEEAVVVAVAQEEEEEEGAQQLCMSAAWPLWQPERQLWQLLAVLPAQQLQRAGPVRSVAWSRQQALAALAAAQRAPSRQTQPQPAAAAVAARGEARSPTCPTWGQQPAPSAAWALQLT